MTSPKGLRDFCVLLTIAIAVFFPTPISVFGQGASVELSGEAEQYFQKGLSAARQQEWELAIRYFSDTYEAAPRYPMTFFNLALAHDKAGHELAAIAWFKAYLQAEPETSRREEIEKAITDLEVAVEAKARKIFKQAEETALALPDTDSYPSRKDFLQQIYRAYAAAGELEAALEFAGRHKFYRADDIRSELLEFKAGHEANQWSYGGTGWVDREETFQAVLTLPEEMRQSSLESLMSSYTWRDELDKAYEISRLLPKPGESVYLSDLIDQFAEKERWNEAIVLIGKQGEDKWKFESWIRLIRIAFEKEKPEKAKEFIVEAEKYFDKSLERILDLAEAYLDLGDQDTAERLLDAYAITGSEYAHLYGKMAGLYVRLSHDKKAESLFARLLEEDDRSFGASSIIEGYLKRGEPRKAEPYLPHLRHNVFDFSRIGRNHGKVAWALIKAGKEKDAQKLIKSVPVIPESDQKEATYLWLCYEAVDDRDFTRALEFMEKTRDDGWRGDCVARIAEAQIKSKHYDEALKLLSDHLSLRYYSAEWGYTSLFTSWFRMVDALDEDGNRSQALAVLDEANQAILARKDLDQLKKAAGYYRRFGKPEKEREVLNRIHDLRWVVLAREFEEAPTHNVQTDYREIQKKKAEEIPGALADLARDYLLSLKKLQILTD